MNVVTVGNALSLVIQPGQNDKNTYRICFVFYALKISPAVMSGTRSTGKSISQNGA